MDYAVHFLVAAGLFVAIDAVWLSKVAKKFYYRELAHLIAKKADLRPAVVFYALYMLGVLVFAVEPAIDRGSVFYALKYGAFLGLVMYATYDLTNASTLKNWPAKVTYVDMTWGVFITATVATLTTQIFV
ncbi:MAG: DUF2177 family protein [Candidatus Saccharimonadales bacterium]